MALKIDPKVVINDIRREVGVVVVTLAEKGLRRFGRALGLAGFFAFAAYFGVYTSVRKKAARLQKEIDKAKILAEYAVQFKALRDQLSAAYAVLPNDREQWLSTAVRDSMIVGGFETESFGSVREQEQAGLIFQASSVSLTLSFAQFYGWLLRLENSRPIMHLQSVDLLKKKDRIGENKVICEIATVIAKKRFR